ncbi:ATP-binding cassette sub-family A member 9-like isoform X2 [Engystomops pustulosus]|uniref:ATP-binding cassette sub-family A member 9-like isoform X2 n=1 Tax=Engystomops pustulosus TaxID=76066 RepID=UPI003AFB2DDA
MPSVKMMDPGLWQQTSALLWKNLLLIWRRKSQTVLEWLYHLVLVLLLFSLSFMYHHSSQNELVAAEELGRLDQFDRKDLVFGYVRSTLEVQEIMQKVNKNVAVLGIKLQEFPNEEQMLQNTVGAAVVFDNTFKYYIRYQMNVSSPNDNTKDNDACDSDHTKCFPSRYWKNGFLLLQASIDAAIVEMTTNHSVLDSLVSAVAVKMSSAKVWRRILEIGALTIATCISYVSIFYILMTNITKEREDLREIMRMMGLKDSAYWLSWGLFYVPYVLIIGSFLTLITTNFIFVESSFGVILLLFFLYGISMISFTFMLCALLRSPRYRGTADFFAILFLCILGLLPLVTVLPRPLELFLCIFFPFAFSLGITETIHMENDLQGVFFSDITGDACHVLTSYVSLLLDSILYILLTLYFDKVLPDKNGLKLEPLFFLCPSYWSKGKMSPIPLDAVDKEESGRDDYIEKVPVELLGKEAIRLNKVKKIYGSKKDKTEALRDLDLDVYEGQITALLGHSGAGKTTLLNILGGMSKASGGTASIYNLQLSNTHDLHEIQKRIGFCPQFDVKFDYLTVKENLELFSRIKGIAPRDVKSEVEKVISDLNMQSNEAMEADELSGGQRRRLTLAIALLGSPEVLLLDEPTAGIDPFSRHQVWSILKEHKADRVTLFSTQFMDEADILADRKAVLSNGRLKCVGSSLFLKRKWGIGYHLRMQVSPSCNPDAITSIIQEHVSSAKLSTRNVEDLTFTLPFDKMDSFPDLFSHLDQRVGQDIMSYGVSITTLDDVFLKLEGEAEIEKADYSVFAREQSEDESRDLTCEVDESVLLMSDSGTVTLHGLALWRQQVLTVGRIRLLKLRHAIKSILSILLLLCTFMVFITIFTAIPSERWYIRKLTPDLYFRGPGHRPHKYYTSLLLHNNTGASIQGFVDGLKSQDVSLEVVDGPYNTNTTGYNGAIELSLQDQSFRFRMIGNPRLQSGLPVLLNMISNAFLQSFGSTERIEIWSKPIQPKVSEGLRSSLFFLSLLYMVFGAGIIPYLAMSSAEDYKTKAHSQLRICGLFPSAYWCGQAMLDIALYWLILFLMVAVLFACNSSITLSIGQIAVLVLGILGFGASMVFFTYVIAFLSRKGKVNCDYWSFIFTVLSLLPFLAEVFWKIPSITYIALLTFLPPSNLLGFLVHLSEPHQIVDYTPRTGVFMNVAIKPVILVDSLRKEFKVKSKTLCLKNPNAIGTRHISFHVKKGEVLGLLGPNGAGKTTSILMIAGELEPTAGEVILHSTADSLALLGYCPQSSPLWPRLTVAEHLEIYAAVTGIKRDDADQAIKRVSQALELREHLSKPAKTLSAGVSRKLCFAISMLGNPTIALLDEPSTGLDPKGQQRLWRAIRAAFQNKERGAILTTHYMEEAEAVCDRVAIMVSGKLRCIGSIQQLKSKFGKGYLLEIKVKDSQRVEEIHQEISRIFPQAERQDRFSSLLVYKIPMENVQSLSQAFSQLEEAKRAHDIEEYSFSQPTLEQVFLELAKDQEDHSCQEAAGTWRFLRKAHV